MGARDYQLMVGDESTYGTPVTVTRGVEYSGDPNPIESVAGRTEGSPLRAGSRGARSDRSTSYYDHGEGTITMDVMNKGFGFWLKHMLGTVTTTGPTSSYYTHTGTEGPTSSLIGKSFTAQWNMPFNPTGTNQPVTHAGGKVKGWTLSNDVDSNLVCELDCDFQNMNTATSLVTASYASAMSNLTWAGGVITVGGTQVDVTKVSIQADNGMNVGKRRIRNNTLEKEPTPGMLDVSVSFECDFEDLSHWNRVYAATTAGALAAFSGAWTLGSASLTATVPAVRMDKLKLSDDTGLMQEISGEARYDGSNSLVSLAYVTLDTTP